MPCAGDPGQTCGGSWAIQIYTWSQLEATYAVPSTWSEFFIEPPDQEAPNVYCFADAPAPYRALPNATMYTLQNNTPGTCIAVCEAAGFTLAGLENGNECWCGYNYPVWQGPLSAESPSACNQPCEASSNYTCGGSWAMIIYQQNFYTLYPGPLYPADEDE
jgi:glucan endo-1,3-alpha-glucosidase